MIHPYPLQPSRDYSADLRGHGVARIRERDEAHDGCSVADCRVALDLSRAEWLQLTHLGVRGVRLRWRGQAFPAMHATVEP